MSNPVIFDAYACVKRIAEPGVSEDMAEAIIGSFTELLSTDIATKADRAHGRALNGKSKTQDLFG